MIVLTLNATLKCEHTGKVILKARQNFVTVAGIPVLVDNDPERKEIVKCMNIGPGIKPCILTLKTMQGYSDVVTINGKRVCLSTVSGLTDGTPPGLVKYKVRDEGQRFVSSES